MNSTLVRTGTVFLFVSALAFAGCGKKEEAINAPAAAAADDAPITAETSPTGVIAAARTALEAGKVDDAAAKLAMLKNSGAEFTGAQARDFRQAMSDAYDKAVELQKKGDPRAEAALELLRAAGPR